MQKTYLARYADPGEYGLESHTCPVDEANGDFCFGVWENMGQLGKSTRNPLVLIVDHFLDLFVLLSLLLAL